MSFTAAQFLEDVRFAYLADSFDEDYVAATLSSIEWLVPGSVWCPELLDEARKLFLAHWLSLYSADENGDGGLSQGPITSMSASQGSQSVSFGGVQPSTDDAQLTQTKWGVFYLALKQRNLCGIQTGFVI